jgi:hypothetical protein
MTEQEFASEEFDGWDYEKGEDVERWKWSREVRDIEGDRITYVVQIHHMDTGWEVHYVLPDEITVYDAEDKQDAFIFVKGAVAAVNEVVENTNRAEWVD